MITNIFQEFITLEKILIMKSHQYLLLVTFFLVTLSLNAQTKYEFMIIEYNNSSRGGISISIDGKEFLSENVERVEREDKKESYMGANPLLIKTEEYQEKGWELMNFETLFNTNTLSKIYFAYLKKKIE
jgi:hypothetical protein